CTRSTRIRGGASTCAKSRGVGPCGSWLRPPRSFVHLCDQRVEPRRRLRDAPIQVAIALLQCEQLATKNVVRVLELARERDQRVDACFQRGEVVFHRDWHYRGRIAAESTTRCARGAAIA